ncbi:LOW QUALITY PROTEIN: hypothetical protein PanWU01x14_248930 [Parasponia andersonii]|uniref:Uncharacterized protein n=1 Tax=Parasponia andersonii TaxID=3476 RepID=A0A2P5BDE1_PARAD|nr:LOW QUALITY PROTEIN: hypothetical protein PanWU01x14_248930 [Parasponia andersonii]
MQVFDRDTTLAILKFKPPPPCEDMLIWKGLCSGEFSVKGAYWQDQQTRFNRKDENGRSCGKRESMNDTKFYCEG